MRSDMIVEQYWRDGKYVSINRIEEFWAKEGYTQISKTEANTECLEETGTQGKENSQSVAG